MLQSNPICYVYFPEQFTETKYSIRSRNGVAEEVHENIFPQGRINEKVKGAIRVFRRRIACILSETVSLHNAVSEINRYHLILLSDIRGTDAWDYPRHFNRMIK